jgi:hypothetical protein
MHNKIQWNKIFARKDANLFDRRWWSSKEDLYLLELLSEKAATFISRALEASSSINSHLLLLKLTCRRFWCRSVEGTLGCVRSGKFVLPILCGFHSKWLNPPLWLIEWGKGLAEDPALCELLNRDVASLVGVNFGNKSLVSCAYCIYLFFIDLEFVLCRSTYLSCCDCKDHLQKSPSIISQLMIQLGCVVSSLILNFV